MDLRLDGLLVRSGDAGELFDLASTSLPIESLGISLLALLDGCVDEDLDKGQRRVMLAVELTGKVSIGSVGRYERGNGQGGRGGDECGELLFDGI